MRFTSNNGRTRNGVTSIPKTVTTNFNMMNFTGVKSVSKPASEPVKSAPKKPVPSPKKPVPSPKKPAPAPKKSVNFEDLNKELDQNIKTIKKEEHVVKRQTRNIIPKKRLGCGCGRR